MKAHHLMLIIATLIIGWYCFKKHKEGKLELPFLNGSDNDEDKPKGIVLESGEMPHVNDTLAYWLATKYKVISSCYDDWRKKYVLTYEDDEFGKWHEVIISEEACNNIATNNIPSIKNAVLPQDLSLNFENAKLTLVEAVATIKKAHYSELSTDSGDCAAYLYYFHAEDKNENIIANGFISKNTFEKLRDQVDYIEYN